MTSTTTQHEARLRTFPWVRLILVFAYLGLLVTGGVYDYNAHRILTEAQRLEVAGKFQTAAVANQIVIETYPFSTAVRQARLGLYRTGTALADGPLAMEPAQTQVERVFGAQLSPFQVDWLPLATWPVCSFLLLVTFLFHVRYRLGVALLALVLASVGVVGLLGQLAYYDIAPIESLSRLASPFMKQTVVFYGTTFGFLACTVFLTLTSARKRQSPARLLENSASTEQPPSPRRCEPASV